MLLASAAFTNHFFFSVPLSAIESDAVRKRYGIKFRKPSIRQLYVTFTLKFQTIENTDTILV